MFPLTRLCRSLKESWYLHSCCTLARRRPCQACRGPCDRDPCESGPSCYWARCSQGKVVYEAKVSEEGKRGRGGTTKLSPDTSCVSLPRYSYRASHQQAAHEPDACGARRSPPTLPGPLADIKAGQSDVSGSWLATSQASNIISQNDIPASSSSSSTQKHIMTSTRQLGTPLNIPKWYLYIHILPFSRAYRIQTTAY